MKNNLGTISKRLVAVLSMFAVFIYIILPMAKVFADNEYVVTFTFEGDYSGHVDDHGTRIIINDADNHDIYTELRSDKDDNNSLVGNVACLTDGSRCTITVLMGYHHIYQQEHQYF